MRITQILLLCLMAVSSAAAGETARTLPADGKGFAWESSVPSDCPFPRSPSLTGLFFTGRHSDYRCGDTFYPSWASDGNLYSPWTDGKTDGVVSQSGKGANAQTGHAVMIGDDPLKLEIRNTSAPKVASALPYHGRYPAGSLVYNDIWYYGTYCLGPEGSTPHNGFTWNWPNLGPMPGFQISRDFGKTWEPSPHSAEKPLFPEPRKFLGPVKMGAPHFVDFGKNMEHSPDGKAYLIGMGAEENDPKPRPCIKPGKPGETYQVIEGCTDDFAHANLSWVTADQAYLARVTPSPETINDPKAYEFFAGHDSSGQPVWTSDFKKIKPLVEWNNHMGCVTATYVPGLKKYLMCVTDGWPTVAKMTSYILEADKITGPWRMVSYMKDFGEQGYFLNFPSKFISPDGQSLWLCYSANFSPGWNGVKLNFNPPGGRYGLCLHEVRLLGPHSSKTGRSLNTEFRPPSAGPYTLSREKQELWDKHPQGAHGIPKAEDQKKWQDEKDAATGVFYRMMSEDVRKVLKDIKRVCPEYDQKAGYELTRFVWLQDLNDLVDEDTYPGPMQPGKYDLYSDLPTKFICDARKDLSAPKMPFVIGVLGVGGESENVIFRKAMAAPADMPEFKGNVVAVETAPFWDHDIAAAQPKQDAYNNIVGTAHILKQDGTLDTERKWDNYWKPVGKPLKSNFLSVT